MKRYARTPLSLALLWLMLMASPGESQESSPEQWHTYERDLKAWCATTAPSAQEHCVREELQRKGFPPTLFDTPLLPQTPEATAVPPSKASIRPRRKTMAQWEQCKKKAIAAARREIARQGHKEDHYFGIDGGGLRGLVAEACGLKPSTNTLSADERAVLEKSCQDDDFTRLPTSALATFYPYGEGSPHWNLATKECNRIYAENAEKQKFDIAQADKPVASPSLPREEDTPADRQAASGLRMCASIGELTEIIVKKRDEGMPLTSILQIYRQHFVKNSTKNSTYTLMINAFVEGFILEIYTKSYWDAVEARRQAETRCMGKTLR